MPVIWTVSMHKSYLRGFRSSEKEDERCLDINLLRVYSPPLEIQMCYASVWQGRWKQGMPPVCCSVITGWARCVRCRGWSRPASPGALLELSSLAKAPGELLIEQYWHVGDMSRMLASGLRFIWKGINMLQSISPWVAVKLKRMTKQVRNTAWQDWGAVCCASSRAWWAGLVRQGSAVSPGLKWNLRGKHRIIQSPWECVLSGGSSEDFSLVLSSLTLPGSDSPCFMKPRWAQDRHQHLQVNGDCVHGCFMLP